MTEQALNKTLAEWLFPPPKYRLAEVSPGYVYPDREYMVERQFTEQVWYYEASLPPFTESLDGCYQWLVPKLQEEGYIVELISLEEKGLGRAPRQRPLYSGNDAGLCAGNAVPRPSEGGGSVFPRKRVRRPSLRVGSGGGAQEGCGRIC